MSLSYIWTSQYTQQPVCPIAKQPIGSVPNMPPNCLFLHVPEVSGPEDACSVCYCQIAVRRRPVFHSFSSLGWERDVAHQTFNMVVPNEFPMKLVGESSSVPCT